MNIRTALIASNLIIAGLISCPAHAALQARDLDGDMTTIEAVYDTVIDATWLADANYAKTSGYDEDGRMPWSDALAWASQLVYFGYSEWRLPDADPDCGHFALNCTLNELGELYYIGLGGEAAGNLLTTHNANYDLFKNIETGSGGIGVFLTSTESGTSNAWAFEMWTGYQRFISKSGANYAWALHDGDIGVAVVPEAGTWAMMLAGLGLVGVAVRRRRVSS